MGEKEGGWDSSALNACIFHYPVLDHIHHKEVTPLSS